MSLIQSAFVSHRDIHDNIFIVHEVLTTFKKIKCAMKTVTWPLLDMEKENDILKGDFLKKRFTNLGFGDK